MALVLGGAGLSMALVYFLVRGRPAPEAPASDAPQAIAATQPPPGPLDAVPSVLRSAIETTLAEYARALESRDPELLARARPDLPAAERSALLARFEGAINVAIDLRVLDVIASADVASVPVLRTDVIVGGASSETAPVEEILRFQRREAGWALDDARR
jgi:hypothetical protein